MDSFTVGLPHSKRHVVASLQENGFRLSRDCFRVAGDGSRVSGDGVLRSSWTGFFLVGADSVLGGMGNFVGVGGIGSVFGGMGIVM